MNSDFWRNHLGRYPAAAAVAYFAVVALFATIAWTAGSDLHARYAGLVAANDLLRQIEGREKAQARGDPETGAAKSPFLEGESVTVAGAALQQRVTSAVTKVGGTVSSSQLELDGARVTNAGFISLTISCELEQAAVQHLLYDLETGNPFLFVDQLVVQASQPGAAQGEGSLRVLLSVSGQWQQPK